MDLLSSILTPKQTKAQEVFDSANSFDEKLKAFEDLESCCKEKDLGLTCFTLALAIHQECDDPEKVLLFSLRALKIITENGSSGSALAVPEILQLLGTVSYDLRRLDDSLMYLNGAVAILEKLDRNSSYRNATVLNFLSEVENQLYTLKVAMGKMDESMLHVRKMLEVVEKISGKYSKDFAKSSREVSDIYLEHGNFGESLHCCLSAMEAYQKVYGDDSWEVAECRKQLGIIYCGLGKHDKGLEQNLLSQTLLKNLDCAPLLLRAEIEAAHMLNHLGKYKEAVEKLRVIVPKTEKLSQDRIMALTYIAEFLCCQGKLAEAKISARKVFEILDKSEESIPSLVAVGFMKIAKVYADMKDYQTALICLKRVPQILEKLIPKMRLHSYLRDLPLRYASLLMLTGEMEQSIPFIEEGVNTMKHFFGSKHANVGRAYGTLGSVYHILGSSCFDVNKLQLSANFLTYAKEILDKSLGPLHKDSIMACKSLCRTYIAMESYSDAMKILDETILRIEAFGLSSPDELAEVDRMMDTLKIMATANVSESHLKGSSLPLKDKDDSAKDSQSVISDAHNYSRAINLEENLVERLKEKGPPNAQENLNEAAKLIEKLMNEASLSRA